jgi:vancomycin resistance protein YoaR
MYRPSSKFILQILAVFFVALNTFFITYHVYFARRIVPGVYVGRVKIGGMSVTDARSTLIRNEPKKNTSIYFKYKNYTYQTTLDEISLKYDWEKTLQTAVTVGRSGNFFADVGTKTQGLFGSITIKPDYTYDEEAFQAFTAKIDGSVNIPESDAYFKIVDDKLVIIPEKEGSTIEIKKLKEELKKNFDTLTFKLADIPVTKTQPDITQAELEKKLDEVERIISKELTLVHASQTYSPTPTQLLKYVKATEASNGDIELSLDLTKVSDIVSQANALVFKSPRGKITKLEKDKVISFELIESGEELNKDKFLEDLETALFDSNTLEPTISLATIEIDTTKDLDKYGIKELIGFGSSKYLGSIPSREKNLLLASERLDGALVAPGQIFSFNKTVGEINAKTGYASAYVIQNGRTVLGDGGGVCQTSTTIFRAALNTGLEIVTRHPHAYRVAYYEQDSGPGFDASIYQPSLDFQFKNDTANYILIETTANTEEKTLRFNIYGTKDGRKVEVSKPVLTNQSAPPPTAYIDDPTLKKGVRVQTEHATWGAKALLTRTVTKDGEILHNDTFTSNYQPWRAVFMVGTKE